MKPPPKKTEEEMTMKELREHKKIQEAEAEALRIEQEQQDRAILRTTSIQNYLVETAERDIRIAKSKIDDAKERYYDFDHNYGFADKLEELYEELATAEHKLQMIRLYPFNAPISTDTRNRNHCWYKGGYFTEAYHEATSQYEKKYNLIVDKDKELYHNATNQYEDLRDNCPF